LFRIEGAVYWGEWFDGLFVIILVIVPTHPVLGIVTTGMDLYAMQISISLKRNEKGDLV
jgi:hypothetical protein